MVSSVISLLWSLSHYYHYIKVQLWSSEQMEVLKLASTTEPPSKQQSSSPPPKSTTNTKNNPISTNATYKIPPLNSSSYSQLTHYMDKSVIFMGMLHNSESTLPHILNQLNEISCLFKETHFLFFESNSIDNTTQILDQWVTHQLDDTYCRKLSDANIQRAPNISKHMIYGDEIVSNELHKEIKKRSNSTYAHTLSRVEKFVVYRNMMLSALYNYTKHIHIDYFFMIDMDVYEIDFFSFLRELIDCPTDIMCINGVDQYDDYRDSFATVETSHNWIHRPFIFNKTASYYEKARNILRKKMPRRNERYERVRSCFNGLASYRMDLNQIVQQNECKYYSNDDILMKQSEKKEGSDEWIYQVSKLINWSNLKGVMFDDEAGYESNLCEHISFHYCLAGKYNISLSIAKDTKLYYYPLIPPQTKESRREERRRKRRAARRKKRAERMMKDKKQKGQ